MQRKNARDIPLYTATYKLLLCVDGIMDAFKRDRKHTLGQWIYNTTLDLFEQLRKANDCPNERESALVEFLGKYDNIATMLKLAHSKGYIPDDLYIKAIQPLGNVERQANGWLVATRRSESAPGLQGEPK